MPRVFGGLGKPFRKPRSNPQERRTNRQDSRFACDSTRRARHKDVPSEPSGMGPPFFWILFFGGAKKSIAVVGPRTDIKTTVAPAIQKINTQPVYTKFRTPSSFNALSFTHKAFWLAFIARSLARKAFCLAFTARSFTRRSFCVAFNALILARQSFCVAFAAGDSIDKTIGVVGPVSNRTAPVKRFE